MSRELRLFLVTLVGMGVLYLGVGSMLPQQWRVESTAVLRVPPAKVLPLLADFNAWGKWSSMASTARANTQMAVEGAPGSIGHQIVWRATDNEAALRLTRIGEDGIDYDFLSRMGEGTELRMLGRGRIHLTATPDGCNVQWSDESRAEAMTERWFAWFGAQQEAARKFQQTSLASLRVQLEGN